MLSQLFVRSPLLYCLDQSFPIIFDLGSEHLVVYFSQTFTLWEVHIEKEKLFLGGGTPKKAKGGGIQVIKRITDVVPWYV